jgi:hypothetical protein
MEYSRTPKFATHVEINLGYFKKNKARKEHLLDTQYKIHEVLPVMLVSELEYNRYHSD